MIKLLVTIFIFNFSVSAYSQVRGTDDRTALTILNTPQERSAGVVTNFEATARGPNWFTTRHANFGNFTGLCEGENLGDANMIRGANCSLTMVAPTIAVTAAHCLQGPNGINNCGPNQQFLFGMTANNLAGQRNVSDHMTFCQQVLASGWNEQSQDQANDWAIIQLTDPVNNFTAPPIAGPGLPRVGENVSTIGTPQGIPSVRSTGVIDYVDTEGRGVRTNMDVVGGNSGGGVFNSRGEFIGVITTSWGRDRILYYEPSGCARWVQADQVESEHDGTWVTANGFVPLDYFRTELNQALVNAGHPAIIPTTPPVSTPEPDDDPQQTAE